MKRFDQFRQKRQRAYNNLFGASPLCAAGFLAMPALLFNPDPLLRMFQFLGFWCLCWLAGKKNNPLLTVLVALGIVIFNLIIPYGQVLFSLGPFKITTGALMTGIQRAATLEGLLMLSRLTIRRDLKIPGLFGELIGGSFAIFANIMDSRPKITAKNLVKDIDRLMLELDNDEFSGSMVLEKQLSVNDETVPVSGTRPLGYGILAVFIFLSWLPFVMGIF